MRYVMAKKFYVVWAGRKPGIYTLWDDAKKQVDGFSGAKYRSFKSKSEAEQAFNNGNTALTTPIKKPNAAKKASTTKQGSSQDHTPTSDIDIYTDGGCEPNPGKAGSGLALYKDGVLAELYYGLFNPNGTNNTAELNALYQALLLAEHYLSQGKSVHIHSDSQYSIKCISEWAYGWKSKGWVKKTGEIKNLEIIQQAHTLFDSLKDRLKLSHVSAHVGIEGNELADRMSIYTIDQQETKFVRYSKAISIPELLSLRAG